MPVDSFCGTVVWKGVNAVGICTVYNFQSHWKGCVMMTHVCCAHSSWSVCYIVMLCEALSMIKSVRHCCCDDIYDRYIEVRAVT